MGFDIDVTTDAAHGRSEVEQALSGAGVSTDDQALGVRLFDEWYTRNGNPPHMRVRMKGGIAEGELRTHFKKL